MKRLEGYDLIILLMAVALTCFGVVMVYSASSVMAAKKFNDGFYFLKRQGVFALLGFGLMAFTMRIDYQQWRRLDALLLAAVTDGLNRLFSNSIAPLRLVRDFGLAVVNRVAPLKRYLMRDAMGVTGDLPRLVRGLPL